jgi:hypothetical protein
MMSTMDEDDLDADVYFPVPAKIVGEYQCLPVDEYDGLKAEVARLRAALLEIAIKGVTTGYGRAALARLARAALDGGEA